MKTAKMISLSKNFPYPYKIKKPKTQFLQPDRHKPLFP